MKPPLDCVILVWTRMPRQKPRQKPKGNSLHFVQTKNVLIRVSTGYAKSVIVAFITHWTWTASCNLATSSLVNGLEP